ncbi:MAG: MBL fold metallo-hydrolase [Nitrososphaerales archaeon]
MFEYSGVKISWLGHDGFKIKNDVTIYIDPFQISGGEKADIVLVTHEHFDHLSPEDIKKVSTPDTTIVAPKIAESGLKGIKCKQVLIIKPGEVKEVKGVSIQAVPAYNINKFRAPGQVFHPKEDGRVGYVVKVKGVSIYHAGDTDAIPEVKKLNVDIALLPVSGTYVMTADEAIELANTMKPKLAIPMHYAAIVGSEADAQRFKKGVVGKVEILEKE